MTYSPNECDGPHKLWEDTPWRYKTAKRWSPFGGDLPLTTFVYNRHGDTMAQCSWEGDAARIVEAANSHYVVQATDHWMGLDHEEAS